MWLLFALLSALFMTPFALAKLGIDYKFNSATAIRTVVAVVMAWGMVFLPMPSKTNFCLKKKLDFSSCPDLPLGASWSATVHYSWETPRVVPVIKTPAL